MLCKAFQKCMCVHVCMCVLCVCVVCVIDSAGRQALCVCTHLCVCIYGCVVVCVHAGDLMAIGVIWSLVSDCVCDQDNTGCALPDCVLTSNRVIKRVKRALHVVTTTHI